MINNTETDSKIVKFYSNRSIFITGGSGFIGQVIIEKLLYSCADIEKIYLLIRPKTHLSPTERIQKLTDSVLFSRLKNERPEALTKIVPLEGEMTLPNLGLSVENQNLLIQNVSIVFHVAATVRFDEPVRVAMAINVEGALQLLELSKRFYRIDAFVYVSSAYSNMVRDHIEEKVYPPPAHLHDVYRFMKDSNEDEDLKTLLAGWQNTYTFTKALAENQIMINRGDCPVIIMRPSIVSPIYKEPIEGWLNNWNGPTSLHYFAGVGLHRSQMGDPEAVADFIPVDYVTNIIIVAATKASSKKFKVYNCCTGPRNPVKWGFINDLFIKCARDRRENTFPWPWMVFTKSIVLKNILTFFFLILPCFIFDFWRWLRGEPPKYKKLQSKIRKVESKVNFASLRQWSFEDDNVRELSEELSPKDRELFYCDVAEIDWHRAIENYYLGVHKYLVMKV